jgi:hypothetical protein
MERVLQSQTMALFFGGEFTAQMKVFLTFKTNFRFGKRIVRRKVLTMRHVWRDFPFLRMGGRQ